MLLRIKEIPPQGREINFDLDNESLNSRISASNNQVDYVFSGPTPIKMKVVLQGSTAILEGKATGNFVTSCSRCAEKVSQHIEIPINMILKPAKEDKSEEEDLNFGYYDGEVINCTEIVEELLVIALPIAVRCETEICKNSKDSWVFGEELDSNNPFKDIKLVH